jgi:hypothetical protein
VGGVVPAEGEDLARPERRREDLRHRLGVGGVEERLEERGAEEAALDHRLDRGRRLSLPGRGPGGREVDGAPSRLEEKASVDGAEDPGRHDAASRWIDTSPRARSVRIGETHSEGFA